MLPRPDAVRTARRGLWFGRVPYREVPATPAIEAAGGRYADALARWHATREPFLAHLRAQSDLYAAACDVEVEIERHDRESLASGWFRGLFRVQGILFFLRRHDVGARESLVVDVAGGSGDGGRDVGDRGAGAGVRGRDEAPGGPVEPPSAAPGRDRAGRAIA